MNVLCPNKILNVAQRLILTMVWEHTHWDCESSILWVKRSEERLQNAETAELKHSPKTPHKPQTIWKPPFCLTDVLHKGSYQGKMSHQIQGSATKNWLILWQISTGWLTDQMGLHYGQCENILEKQSKMHIWTDLP